MPSTADAASREAAWLNSFGDGLPALTTANGGPWDLIQAYNPRTPGKRKNTIYVTRPEFRVDRFANIRQMAHYTFKLAMMFSLSNISGSEEIDQTNFDVAVDLVLQRILGLPQDKTHGGRFLAVAEKPEFVHFEQVDPVQTIVSNAAFIGSFTYHADDFEYTG
ncbi:MAG TPA: hypothetical protein VIY48_17590 [Candidatus Paceibacterota bacterium]